MPLLVGRYDNKIDRKGRVSVPKLFRDVLQAANGGSSGLYAYPSFNDEAIEVCGEDFMNRVAQGVEEMNLFSEDQDEMASAIFESAHWLQFDPEGRIVLPAELIEHAGIDGEAAFVGRGTSIQIWSPEKHTIRRKQKRERIKERKPTLKLGPAGQEG